MTEIHGPLVPIKSVEDTKRISKGPFRPLHIYYPAVGDHVIGIVTAKNADFYTLNIKALCEAVIMSIEDFRGATKRNKPELNEGDVIFCQITRHYPRHEMPTEVSCIDADSVKQWTTNECYFGPLVGGITFDVPIIHSISLSKETCYSIQKCGAKFKFEVAVGLNGRVWVKGSNIQETLLISRFIKRSFGCSLAQMEALYLKLFS